jgi:hypothetical protein
MMLGGLFYWALLGRGIRSDLKNWVLVPDQGGREFQAGGIRRYFEELK